MIQTVLNLAIVCGAMFLAVKVIDVLFRWLKIKPKREGIQPNKSEQVMERAIDSLQLAEYSPHHVSITNSCEIEAGIVCDEIANNIEGLAESVGESISAIIEGLAN